MSRNTLLVDIAKPVVHSSSGQVVYCCPMSAGISGRSRADLAQITGHGRRFVTVADAADSLRVERPEAARRLARWAEQGWLRRVRRDLYIPVPVDTVHPEGWGADPLVLADAVWGPCYATGWTAANHWGLTEQSFRTTVVKTVQRVRRTDQRLLDNDFLIAHTSPELLTWGMKREWREERRIQIADPARTVIDALDDLRLVGGIRLATEILAAYLDAHDPDSLVSYGDRLANRTVFKRIGLLGEVIGANPGLLADCESRLSAGFPMLDPTQPPAGIRSQRWRLLVNARIDDLEPS